MGIDIYQRLHTAEGSPTARENVGVKHPLTCGVNVMRSGKEKYKTVRQIWWSKMLHNKYEFVRHEFNNIDVAYVNIKILQPQ